MAVQQVTGSNKNSHVNMLQYVTILLLLILILLIAFLITISSSNSNLPKLNSTGIIAPEYDVLALTSLFPSAYVRVNMSTYGYVTGSFSSTSPINFYVMTPSELQAFLAVDVPILIGDQGAVLSIYNWERSSTVTPFLLTAPETQITGGFESSNPVVLYIMNSGQYSSWIQNGETETPSSTYVVPSTTSASINTSLPPGDYYLVFWNLNYNPPNSYSNYASQNISVTVTSPIIATALPKSNPTYIYKNISVQNQSFNVPLNSGSYYLVWYNQNGTTTQGAVVETLSPIKIT